MNNKVMELNFQSGNAMTWLIAAVFVGAVAAAGLPVRKDDVRVIPAESSISIIPEDPADAPIIAPDF